MKEQDKVAQKILLKYSSMLKEHGRCCTTREGDLRLLLDEIQHDYSAISGQV